MNHKENEALNRLMVQRRAIEARSAADKQIATDFINNQTVELLQDQEYIYDFEDSQAKVRIPFRQSFPVHINHLLVTSQVRQTASFTSGAFTEFDLERSA